MNMLIDIKYFNKVWHMARVQQILLAGRVSGSDEGSMSRNITVLQRSKLRLR